MSKLSQSKRQRVAVPIPGGSRFAKYTPGFMQYAPQEKAPSRRDRIRAARKHRRLAAGISFGYGGVRQAGRNLARMSTMDRVAFKINPGAAMRKLRHEHR